MSRERPPRSQIKQVYRRDNYRCQNCNRKGGEYGDAELHAHHIVPLKDGGSNQLSNLQTLCKECHRAIHDKSATAPTDNSNSHQQGEAVEDLMMVLLNFIYYISENKMVAYGSVLVYLIGILFALALDSPLFAVVFVLGAGANLFLYFSEDLDKPKKSEIYD